MIISVFNFFPFLIVYIHCMVDVLHGIVNCIYKLCLFYYKDENLIMGTTALWVVTYVNTLHLTQVHVYCRSRICLHVFCTSCHVQVVIFKKNIKFCIGHCCMRDQQLDSDDAQTLKAWMLKMHSKPKTSFDWSRCWICLANKSMVYSEDI